MRNPIGMIRRSQQLRSKLKAPRERLPGGSRRWIRTSMDWFISEFGRDVLLRPIALPVDLIPDGYDGSLAAATELCGRVDNRMDLRPGQCALSFELNGVRRPVDGLHGGGRPVGGLVVKEQSGRWIRGNGSNQIQLAPALMADPVALIAIYAHEAGHELLLGSGRITLARRPDHEPLTDLVTVFYGLGIFTANAAYERRPRPNGRGKQPLARGYLRETALAEALAHYAKLRGERHPEWSRHLDPPVRRGLNNQLTILHR
ncbi:hypothetical protein [Kribbella sindirgiensis]|uniref:Uncharacterized protein n=1 Tax=Kribbella sindirgiensis TaxID=1124744 RepID=A0A4V2M5F3_9ACTN|nr:hypothetical protein [Kribbella sindirgiensis]TCC39642.1 hypothetical protein E0H50_06905 [Kribbella sindirgiensis]